MVAGFRVERRLGDNVWQATQPELGRPVALRRLEPGVPFNASAWPDRPGVVSLFAVVNGADGTYLATRFVPGARTLAECAGARPARRRRWLQQAAATLGGVVHGDLTASDILIDGDGRVHVTGFGRGGPAASAADDRAALEALRPPERQRLPLVPIAAGALALLVLAAVLLFGADDDGDAIEIPAVAAGATGIGSTLTDGPIATVDCEGLSPSRASPPCTIVQTALPGRPLVVSGGAVTVRRWVVRGATGPVALMVLRPQGRGFQEAGRSRTERVNAEVAAFATDLTAPVGSHFALRVETGGGIGIHRGAAGAVTARFFGAFDMAAPLVTDTGGGRGEELLLRVDVAPR